MAWWAWVLCALCALLGLGLLALALFRVRYRLEWRGEWSGTLSGTQEGAVQIRYGFPFFMKTWNPLEDDDWTFPNPFDIGDEADGDSSTTTRSADAGPGDPFATSKHPGVSPPPREPPVFLKPEGGTTRRAEGDTPHARDAAPLRKGPAPRPPDGKDPNRKRRALFRFITDPDVWKFVARYGLKALSLVFGLLKPRAEAALGHPDPVRLGRLAGKWYAVRPFLPLGDTVLHFRFQDRHPTVWVKAEGGFSLLSVLGFGLRLLLAFPLIRFGRSAWKGWRQHKLSGWRAWVYRNLQTR